MYAIEKKFITYINKHLHILFFVIISLLGFFIRYLGFDFISGDMNSFLIPWFYTSSTYGGIQSLGTAIGNYGILYQTFISLMTYIPIDCVYLYKMLSIIFDYLLAYYCSIFICELTGAKKWQTSFNLIYATVLLLPTVVFNSAFWGQCDSIYTTFILLTLLYAYRKKYFKSFIFLGIAFAFKLQAIFIIPFMICLYFYQQRFSICLFGVSLISFWLSGTVGYLFGRNLLDPFMIYFSQANTYEKMYLNISSFWLIVGDDWQFLNRFAIFFTLLLCGIALYIILLKKKRIDTSEQFINTATWFVWTCILFLPAMHERYTYPLDILLILLVFIDRKYLKYAVLSILLSLITYGAYLFGNIGTNAYFAIANLIGWLHYTYTILKNDASNQTIQKTTK